jgi:membrane protein implicated in regulation of membrane protease activity
MMTIILYIIGGIIVLALASALLPYILAGGMIYAIYRNWDNITGWFSGVKHWNWKMIGLVFAGFIALGLFVQWFEKRKYPKKSRSS